jgi:hypothetical protein
MILGVGLKRDYPLFYHHETFAKHLIASQGANIPERECMECVHQGTNCTCDMDDLSEVL